MRRVVSARALAWANLSLLVLFPIAWMAPLIRAGLLPLFGLSEISVLSGIASLWGTAPALAVLVALLAVVAPYAKTLTLAAVQFGYLARKPAWLIWLGRLAMADIFLIALYVVIVKGIGLGRVEVAWGLALFTACVFASLVLSYLATPRGGLTPDAGSGKTQA
ncbi:paraquat-inducible protein A [Dinoroseobacter sp. S124A]|uniref:paraquat-inducible protein A n=1 Tax=Dinoroseobacter sp. S124A TaxID=3415128 RepID=UPI003C79A85F